MIGKDELVAAQAANEKRLKEAKGENSPQDVMDEELGIEMLDLLLVGYEYASPKCPEGAGELMTMLHTAYVMGAMTMARAIRTEQARRAVA